MIIIKKITPHQSFIIISYSNYKTTCNQMGHFFISFLLVYAYKQKTNNYKPSTLKKQTPLTSKNKSKNIQPLKGRIFRVQIL